MAPLTALPGCPVPQKLYDDSVSPMRRLHSLSIVFRRQNNLEKGKFVSAQNPFFVFIVILGILVFLAIIGTIYARCTIARRKALQAKQAFDRRRSSVMSLLGKGPTEKGRVGSVTSSLGADEDWTPQRVDKKPKLEAIREVPSRDDLQASASIPGGSQMPSFQEVNKDEDKEHDSHGGRKPDGGNAGASLGDEYRNGRGNGHGNESVNEYVSDNDIDCEQQETCERCGGYVGPGPVCEGCGEPVVDDYPPSYGTWR
ncbi:MAG: hypothetical protein Q9187_007227 [Circinaria calcarea]